MRRLAIDEVERVARIPARLWDGVGTRSAELTPLYVERYVGPRQHSTLTAHSFTEVTYCTSGRGLLVAGAPVALRAHRAVLLAAGIEHGEDAPGELETIWIGLRGALVDRLPASTILTLDEPGLTPVVERLWEVSQSFPAGGGMECDALARLLVARILRGAESGGGPDLVTRAVALMHERLRDPVTVSWLAGELSCSEGYLHRSFKARTGETPVQCLTRLRMERALNLIRCTRMSLKQIAHRVGYRDPLYFSRVFRGYHGRPPREAAREARLPRRSPP